MRYGQATHLGNVRTTNEDGVFSSTLSAQFHETQIEYSVFMVIDSMGGAGVGERVTALIMPIISLHLLLNMVAPNFDLKSEGAISRLLVESLQAGNHAIFHDHELKVQGGAAVTVAVVINHQVFVGHVGDTRAYLINSEACQQITIDHFFHISLDNILLPPDSQHKDEDYPMRHVLYRALGQVEDMEVDICSHPLPEKSYLLLCSDGLKAHVRDAEIHQAVIVAPTPQAACDYLVALANERGGFDNISVIVVQV